MISRNLTIAMSAGLLAIIAGGCSQPEISLVGVKITSHGITEGYGGACILCHGEGTGPDQYPLPPVWDGSPHYPGPVTIEPDSLWDHSQYSNFDCLDCHT